ncbi:hypothetical protein FDP41_006406 [Naegleria fowleri]|uniref:Citrate transporter-like domain-containing protein n=1 Tax=Naegleria fowleri TaxID=5763 RepID=A0A6A5BK05_NAEFO|nr:uncharacterized protein FDP41_006406 [Naegleria fowleri]KAF0974374.1 hypothetical protein FDP41_006406 [Naegleria fowleri]
MMRRAFLRKSKKKRKKNCKHQQQQNQSNHPTDQSKSLQKIVRLSTRMNMEKTLKNSERSGTCSSDHEQQDLLFQHQPPMMMIGSLETRSSLSAEQHAERNTCTVMSTRYNSKPSVSNEKGTKQVDVNCHTHCSHDGGHDATCSVDEFPIQSTTRFFRPRKTFGNSFKQLNLLIMMIKILLISMMILLGSGMMDRFLGTVEASSYRFLSEFTKTANTTVLSVFPNSTNVVTNVTTTTTIGFGSFTYTYETDSLSWQILMDTELPSFSNTSSVISLRFWRLIHSNVLFTQYARTLFVSKENLTQALVEKNLLNSTTGVTIVPEKMLFPLNGTTKGKLLNTTLYVSVPELFENSFMIQLFELELNATLLQDNSSLGTNPTLKSDKILVNFSLFKGKNPTYTYSILETLKSALRVVSVSTMTFKNLCSSSSPVVAFAWNSWKLWFVLCVILGMLGGLVMSWWKPYFVVFLALVVLNVSGVINVTQTLAGFSNDGMLTVLILFPIVQPISENSLVLKVSKLVFGSPKYGLWLCMLRVCLFISLVSPFINNTPIVVTLIPIIKDWARVNNIAPSKFLIPMCFMTSAAGLMTLIGTSTNIVTNGLYVAYGFTPFTFYEFFYIGSILSVVTIVYLCTFGLWVLPNKKGGMFRLARERGEQFLTKIAVDDPNSPLIGKNKHAIIQHLGLEKLEVVEIIRKKPRLSTSAVMITANPTSTTELSTTTQENVTKLSTQDSHDQSSSIKEEEDLVELIVPVPDDLTIMLGDVIIFKGHPNMILKLHSKTGISENLPTEEGAGIIHTMLGTADMHMEKQVTVNISSSQQASHVQIENLPVSTPSALPNAENSSDGNLVVEISDSSEINSSNDFIQTHNVMSPHLEVAPPIPKATLKSLLSENQGLYEAALRKTIHEEPYSQVANASSSSETHAVHHLDVGMMHEDQQQQQLEPPSSSKDVVEHGTAVSHIVNNSNHGTSTDTPPKKTHMTSTDQSSSQEKSSKKQPFSFAWLKRRKKPPVEQDTSVEKEPEFFELIISVSNPCIGFSYAEFEKRYGVVVLAVRYVGLETKTDVTDFKTSNVSTGDTLLVIGRGEFYSKWHESKDFYVISRCNVNPKESKTNKFIVKIPFTNKEYNLWWWEHLIFPIFIAMIACAIAGYSMLQCAMVTLCVVIILGLIQPIKALESVEWPLIALIGSSFGIGTAITQSGMGEAFAEVVRLMNIPNILLPAVVVFITLIVTAVITNNAAVAITFPLAMAVAIRNGLNPRCFAMCVCIAASSVFATPIGYQCNMMVYGTGGYSFMDYVKSGLPLTFLYFVCISTFVPLIWGLETPNF